MATSLTSDLMFASEPEKKVYYSLIRLGEPFTFQSQMLGQYQQKGSTIADFALYQYRLVLRVVGEYWHSFPGTKARDRLQLIALESQGWKVVDLMESDINRNVDFYVREAIRGVSYAREL